MFVGILKIDIYLYQIGSLKEKRKFVNRVKDRLRNMFYCSIAETGSNDILNKVEFGLSSVSSEKTYLDGLFDKVESFLYEFSEIEMINLEKEIIKF